jgi:hypothetical protein
MVNIVADTVMYNWRLRWLACMLWRTTGGQLADNVACSAYSSVQLVCNWFKTGLKLGDTVADGEYHCGHSGVQLADTVACLDIVADNWRTTGRQCGL